jgi:hypothetical protein
MLHTLRQLTETFILTGEIIAMNAGLLMIRTQYFLLHILVAIKLVHPTDPRLLQQQIIFFFSLFQRAQKIITINTTPTTLLIVDSIIAITIAIPLTMIPITPTILIFLISVVIIAIEILDIKGSY